MQSDCGEACLLSGRPAARTRLLTLPLSAEDTCLSVSQRAVIKVLIRAFNNEIIWIKRRIFSDPELQQHCLPPDWLPRLLLDAVTEMNEKADVSLCLDFILKEPSHVYFFSDSTQKWCLTNE